MKKILAFATLLFVLTMIPVPKTQANYCVTNLEGSDVAGSCVTKHWCMTCSGGMQYRWDTVECY